MTAAIPQSFAHLQMQFMCWDMDIEHRNDHHLVDANYWPRLGADLCFDPLLKDYLQCANFLCKKYPSPTTLPMFPVNQPYYQPPQNPPRVDDSPSAAAIQLQDIFPADPIANKIVPLWGGGFPNADGTGMQYLSTWPVSFGEYSSKSTPIVSTTVCSL
jgi:hypothetical protein